MKKRKILIVTADRAEKGLLDSVMAELKKREDVKATWLDLSEYRGVYVHIFGENYYGEETDFTKFDIVVIPCDRNEMVYMAAKVFHEGAVLAHFHAGNNSTNHPDDFNRRAISLFSHIMLANMPEHKQNLICQGEEESRIHVVGSTAFDNIIYDSSVTPKHPFSLVILHPDPTSADNTKKDLEATVKALGERDAVWIYPNHDTNYQIIENYLDILKNSHVQTYKGVPRNQFLDLLRNCEYAIGNSSSFYYELPVVALIGTLIQIGERNKGLIVPETKTGGSKRIAELLATIELTEQLRNKKFGVK